MAEINWTENQKRAIQARSCSIAVSAAAGSGKTAVLTNRIIERIKAGGDIKTMLVVTFTNPAAQQLKDKISDELNNALFDKQLTPKEKKHLQRQLIALPNATISTIDSFVIGLVRDNFSEAGIPVGSGVMDEAEKKQLETDVADMLIQDYYEGKITSEDRKIDDFDSFVNVFGDPLKPSVLAENIISLKNYYDTQPHPYDSILGENEDGVFEESSFGKILFNYTKSMFEYYSELFKIASEEYDMDGETKNSELFVGIKDFCDKVLDALKNKDAYSSVKELLSEYSNKTISKSGSLYHDYFKNKKSDLKSDIDSLKEKYYCYTEDDINSLLGRLSFESLLELSTHIINSDGSAAVTSLEKIYNDGNEPIQILTNLMLFFTPNSL